MVAVVDLVPEMNLARPVGRMFLIQSLAAPLPPEIVPQLLCGVELRMAGRSPCWCSGAQLCLQPARCRLLPQDEELRKHGTRLAL